VIGKADKCRDSFYAITAERRISNKLVTKITESAKYDLNTVSGA